MLKRLFLPAAVILFVVACSNKGDNDAGAPAATLEVSTLTTQADQYVDQTVNVSGTVVHVCRHGGKKMFIIGDDPEQRFKITAGPQIGAFDVALEGSTIHVQGVVQVERAEAASLTEHEMHEDAAAEAAQSQDGECEEEARVTGDKSNDMQEQTASYSLECSSYEEVKL